MLRWAAIGYAGLLAGGGFYEFLFGRFWMGAFAIGFAVLLATVTDAAYRKGNI